MNVTKQLFFTSSLIFSLVFTLEFLVDDAIGTNVSPTIDTDGDGISDEFEKNGIDTNNDGTIDLKLGIDTNNDGTIDSKPNYKHKDLFLEIDYMPGFKPIPETIENVKQAFNKANVNNPDNFPGINLHVLVNEEMTGTEYTKEKIKRTEMEKFREKYFGTELERNDINKKNILNAKANIYHYGIFVNKIEEAPTRTGFGFNPLDPPHDIPIPKGMNFIVSLGIVKDRQGGIPLDFQQGTLMHELGHTLGLFHGGHDSKPYKPHYFSVMNYLFQEGSIKRDLDYSRCEINLNENNLNEFDGIIDKCKNSRDSRFFTKSNCNLNSPLSQLRHIVTNTKINWNTNGQYEQFVEHDVNCDRSKDQRLNVLNDWKGICYVCPLKSNEENADFIEESPTFKEEKTSIQQLEEELSYEDAIDLRYAATVGFINDTLNSLPSSVFQSNISNTQDESSFMFDSEESSVNESSLIKQSIASMLGVGSNENRTAITDDNLFLDEAVVDINVTREIYDNNPDAAIDGLETILQITDSYLNRTGEDDWVAGKENQKQFGDAILSAIDSLQRQSCTYTKCG